MIGSLTGWVLRHRLFVVVVWVVLACGGVVAAGSLGSAFSKQFSIPGKAIATSARIAREFGAGGQTAPLVGVITSRQDLASPRAAGQAQTVFARMSAAEPGSRLASYVTTGDRSFLSPDHRTEFALVFPTAPAGGGQLSSGDVAKVRRAAKAIPLVGAQFHVTGLDALRNTSGSGKGNGVVVEAMLGAVGALAVLAFVFASFIAFVPLVNAAVAILTTLLIVRGVAAVSSVSMIVQFLIALIGLGVAIDYSLLVIVRWREERAKGAENEQAV